MIHTKRGQRGREKALTAIMCYVTCSPFTIWAIETLSLSARGTVLGSAPIIPGLGSGLRPLMRVLSPAGKLVDTTPPSAGTSGRLTCTGPLFVPSYILYALADAIAIPNATRAFYFWKAQLVTFAGWSPKVSCLAL